MFSIKHIGKLAVKHVGKLASSMLLIVNSMVDPLFEGGVGSRNPDDVSVLLSDCTESPVYLKTLGGPWILIQHKSQSNLSVDSQNQDEQDNGTTYTQSRIHLLNKSGIICERDGCICWGNSVYDAEEITIVPNCWGTLIVNGIQYDGKVKVSIRNGNLYIMNILPLEDYVDSVVSKQSTMNIEDSTMRQNFINLVALVLRTEIFYQKKNSLNEWDCVSTDYMYNGSCDKYTNLSNRKSCLVSRGLILQSEDDYNNSFTYSTTENLGWNRNNKIHTSEYGSNSIFNMSRSVISWITNGMQTNAETNQESMWTYTCTIEQLKQKLALEAGDNITDITGHVDDCDSTVFLLEITTTNKIYNVPIGTFLKKVPEIHGARFRVALEAHDNNTKCHFVGYGHKKSPKICMHSILYLLEKQFNPSSILNIFFPNTIVIDYNTLPQ